MEGHPAVAVSARAYLNDLKFDIGMVGRQELDQAARLPEGKIAASGS
jgi:hypothetical protein